MLKAMPVLFLSSVLWGCQIQEPVTQVRTDVVAREAVTAVSQADAEASAERFASGVADRTRTVVGRLGDFASSLEFTLFEDQPDNIGYKIYLTQVKARHLIGGAIGESTLDLPGGGMTATVVVRGSDGNVLSAVIR